MRVSFREFTVTVLLCIWSLVFVELFHLELHALEISYEIDLVRRHTTACEVCGVWSAAACACVRVRVRRIMTRDTEIDPQTTSA